MYVPTEAQISMANELVTYFLEGNMVSFAKQSAELYELYDEFTADDIMKKVKRQILESALNATTMVAVIEDEIGSIHYHKGYEEAQKKIKADLLPIYQNQSPSGAKLAKIREYFKIEPQDV